MLPELTEKPFVLKTSEGSLCIWKPHEGLVLTQASGRLVLAQAAEIMRAVDLTIKGAHGTAVAVHDWLGVDSYEVSVHARMTTWSVSVMRSLRRVVVGVRSPLVALAVRTVNLAAGGRFEVVGTPEQLMTAARASLQRRNA